MHLIVIISEKVKSYIPEANPDYETVVSGDIDAELSGILGKETKRPLLIVLCIHLHELPALFPCIQALQGTGLLCQLILFGPDEEIRGMEIGKIHYISEFRSSPLTPVEFSFALKKSFSILEKFYQQIRQQHDYYVRLQDTRQDQEDLINIGKALSSEKDQDRLLRLILEISKKITGADAGSIYLVEKDREGNKRLRFKYSHTFSREIPLEEFVMNMDKRSIAGYVACTGEVLNIPDAYTLTDDCLYSFNKSFDQKHSYISRSMLVVPMRNHVDEIIGVIQLINSKENHNISLKPGENEAFSISLISAADFDRYVVRFDERYNSLLEAIAGEAAVAIENNRMIKQIQSQFEEFVKASVTAIESRDPATSGHSFRVAEICTAMARAVNEVDEGPLKDVTFNENAIREIELAALLHDFGKVYIDLAIFQKSKKLFPSHLENLLLKLDYMYRYLEFDYARREIELVAIGGDEGTVQARRALDERKLHDLDCLQDIRQRILKLNEPSVVIENPDEELNDILQELDRMHARTIDGDSFTALSDLDRINLSIKKGSLNPDERKEIESHVVHTYNFVSRIPWPPEYSNIPTIALEHHELLDGTGYPHGLKGRENCLIQARIMTIADIFDALAAHDRPYKKAVPLEKVLSILKSEAECGKLDGDLVDVFIEHRVYEKIISRPQQNQ